VIEDYLLPKRQSQTQQRVFVIHGLGGIGKTQLAAAFSRLHKDTYSSIFWLDGRSEDQFKQSIITYASKIPEGQIPEKSRAFTSGNGGDPESVVTDVLRWLARPANVSWLLILDNFDLDYEQEDKRGVFDFQTYMSVGHGSVLITTRLPRLVQLGGSLQLKRADSHLGYAIFREWYGSKIGNLELLSIYMSFASSTYESQIFRLSRSFSSY
jgi:hypothetical protein